MIYPSAEFIFLTAFLIYFLWALPLKLKPLVLLIGSLFWYSTWAAHWLLVLLALVAVNYLVVWTADRQPQRRKFFFPSLVVFDTLVFIFLKSLPLWSPHTRTPYGISFFMMMLLGVIIDAWRSPKQKPEGLLPFTTMFFFFPLLVGGPIERGRDLFPQLKAPRFDLENLANGILVFSYGFTKRFLVGSRLTAPVEQLFASVQELSGWGLCAAALLSTFQAYVDFSSYCDMGRGAALCFGIKIKFNFRPFYYSKSPHDFWQRWNISIGTWMRDYFTMPLLLRFGRRIPTAVFLFFSFILIGLWHGLQWNWLCFGIFNGLLVVLFVRLQSLLRFSKPLAAACGFILAVVLFVGNGLLQHTDVFELLRIFGTSPGTLAPPPWKEGLIALWPFALGLLVFEYFQERMGDLDFYLKLPAKIKGAGAVACVVTFLALLHFGILTDYKFTLPLYFRL
jgi:D-alanyl-lipoteichoic acid acyltransferase DltB (MBOAT superfamily)